MTDLATKNKKRWDECKVSAAMGPQFKAVADKLSTPEARKRYETVSKATGVPWWFIAVTHYRESSQDWGKSLAQGDPWNKKSIHVPKGRGPFSSWEEAAVDALVNCSPYAARNKDWSLGNSLALLEKYNGLGYYNKGIPSPYLWAGTNQYTSGKYVSDGVFSPTAVDKQLGVAGILKFMGVFNNVSTPVVAGAAIGGGFLYAAWGTIQAHPYTASFLAVALGILTYSVIHSIINREPTTNV